MKRTINDIFILVVIGMLVTMTASALTTGDVNATVTAINVSVTVTSGSVAYGFVALSGEKSTLQVSGSQSVVNGGNVNEDFTIKGFNTTGTGQAWTLDTSTSTLDHYRHEFTASATFPGTALTTSPQVLSSTVAPNATTTLDLKIYTPGTTTDYNEKTAKVTITASAS